MIKTGKKFLCILLAVSLLLADACFINNHTAKASGNTQATIFKSMTNKQIVAKIGKLCQQDMKNSGILASISIAQFILESGYGRSSLTQNANNCFGIKGSLSGSNWTNSTWDGVSLYTTRTKEEYTPGQYTIITASFRKYSSVEDSIADHSAYLRYAKNGSKRRYAGLVGETNYRTAAQIIKDGGYATSSTYVSALCTIIQNYNLTKYDDVTYVGTSDTYWDSDGTAAGSSGGSSDNASSDFSDESTYKTSIGSASGSSGSSSSGSSGSSGSVSGSSYKSSKGSSSGSSSSGSSGSVSGSSYKSSKGSSSGSSN